ncbi:hypothetical protein BGZ79_003284 [Entomortierella chlamydospora]|nr:hypothetical protein BGZ79_003284 [Entomortierella chlamydospora]
MKAALDSILKLEPDGEVCVIGLLIREPLIEFYTMQVHAEATYIMHKVAASYIPPAAMNVFNLVHLMEVFAHARVKVEKTVAQIRRVKVHGSPNPKVPLSWLRPSFKKPKLCSIFDAESFLDIGHLFIKACSSSSHHGSESTQIKCRRVLSFRGSVVHSISKTNIHIDSTSAEASAHDPTTHIIDVPPDPIRFPIHHYALQMFKKLHNGMSPDHIVWLSSFQESPAVPNATQIQASPNVQTRQHNSLERRVVKGQRQKEAEQEGNRVVLILDTDDEERDSATDDGDNDNTSEISWSDSNHGSDSDLGSESGSETHSVREIPNKMVAVLLSDTFLDSSNYNGDSSRATSTLCFRPGDSVWVSEAAMLSEEIEGKMVVSFLGVQGRSSFWITPISPFTAYDRCSKSNRMDCTNQTKKRRAPSEMRSIGQNNDCWEPKKRSRARTPSPKDIHEVIDIESLDKSKIPRKIRPHNILDGVSRTRTTTAFQLDRLLELDPLDLLVQRRENSDHPQGNSSLDSSRIKDLDYFSDILSRSSRPVTAPVTITPPGSICPLANAGTDSNGTQDVTWHICWLTGIRSVMVRAICNECENDYKNKSCIFYCRSHKWRIKTHMECSVSDGTAEANLLIPEDRDDIMWALLGLMKNTRNTSKISSSADNSPTFSDTRLGGHDSFDSGDVPHKSMTVMDQHQDIRKRALRVIARRGVLSFNSTSTTASNQKNISKFASVESHVEANYQTHQEKMEEEFWLKICTAHSKKRETFLLSATTSNCTAIMQPAEPLSSSSTRTRETTTALGAKGKDAKLKTSTLWMNRRTMIQTIVRPPLVIQAVDVEWIQPVTEARILLNRLNCMSKQPSIL